MGSKTLLTAGQLTFEVSHVFETQFLSPVEQYVRWKQENEWDDYNEVEHATRFFNGVVSRDDLWLDAHLLKEGGAVVGCLFLIGGSIDAIESRFRIDSPATSLLLKYFHIVDKGRGLGQKWLSEVIIPHYRSRKYRQIYLSSSHPQSFGFYNRIGVEIASYNAPSDNGIYMRQGKSFVINLAE